MPYKILTYREKRIAAEVASGRPMICVCDACKVTPVTCQCGECKIEPNHWHQKPLSQVLTYADLDSLISMFEDQDCLAAQGVNRLSLDSEADIKAKLEAMLNSK